MAHPKNTRSKLIMDQAAADGGAIPPVDPLVKPAAVDPSVDPLVKPAGEKALGASDSISSTVNNTTAGSSGLSVEEKAVDADGFIEDDSDVEMEIDLDKESAHKLRSTLIMLFPVNLVVAKEVASIIDAVSMLIKRGWNGELSAEAQTTTKFQELLPAYVAKVRFGRLLVSFTLQEDAETVKRKEVLYQRINDGELVKLHWQHTENPAYMREKALNPHALEVIFRGVSALEELDRLADRLSVNKLSNRKRPAFQSCSCLHGVLHPVTGADTETVKGLVYLFMGDVHRWLHVVSDPADRPPPPEGPGSGSHLDREQQ
ncbi:unnamed protein product [Closterium sp. Naga37s-1]|nr:unnamed protein product [Closterium sp. Naga37s-1]